MFPLVVQEANIKHSLCLSRSKLYKKRGQIMNKLRQLHGQMLDLL